MSIEFEVSGDYAMFAEPVVSTGGEKFSYPVPTYEALKGIVEGIYWKPTIYMVVDALRVMNPIQTETRGMKLLKYSGGNDLAYWTYLRDVRYQVRAHFEWNLNYPEFAADRNEGKHLGIMESSLRAGGRRDIFLGTRECPGEIHPCSFGEGKGYYDDVEEWALGFMYHGLTYPNEAICPEDKGKLTVRFWRPVMRHGVIEFVRPELCTKKRHVRDMEMTRFDAKKGRQA